MGHYSIPVRFVNHLATSKGIKHRGEALDKVIDDLEQAGLTDALKHLHKEFRFADSTRALTLCKPEGGFPEATSTPEKLVRWLISQGFIKSGQLGTVWEPPLRSEIQLCGIIQDHSDISIRMVEEKQTVRYQGYEKIVGTYAHFTTAVIHFGEQVIELRCAYTNRGYYLEYLRGLLGLPRETGLEWEWVTQVTKEEAVQISNILSAGLTSTQIAIPSTVGSIRFNAKKGVNLRNDPVMGAIKDAIHTNVKLPTDDTMDETCCFLFTDPVTGIQFEVIFEINLRNGGFKFLTSTITESVIQKIIDAFVEVRYILTQKAKTEIAAGKN